MNPQDVAGLIGGLLLFALYVYPIIIYFSLPFVVGELAQARGRSSVGWIILTFLATPIVTIPAVLGLPPNEDGLIESGRYDRCPQCVELVRMNARRCKNCGNNLVAPNATSRAGQAVYQDASLSH